MRAIISICTYLALGTKNEGEEVAIEPLLICNNGRCNQGTANADHREFN